MQAINFQSFYYTHLAAAAKINRGLDVEPHKVVHI